MANKAISELPQAQNVNNQDLFVLEQGGLAKKLTAETFITEQGIIDALAEALDGHGGIQSVTLQSLSGRIRTYLITFTDGSATTFQVYDGTSIERISRTSSSGLDDVYTVFLSDGTTTFFTVHNGADGNVSEAMLNDALKDKAPAVTETTESSAIATFTDGADNMVMHNVVAEINPVQSGSGDPSPSNIRPISGWTGCNVTRTGKNLLNLDREVGTPIPSDGANTVSPRVMDTSHYYVGLRPDNYYYPSNVAEYSVTNNSVFIRGNNNGYGVGFPVPVKANTTYTVSGVASANPYWGIGHYDAQWNYLSMNSMQSQSLTFTTPADCAYSVIIPRSTDTTNGTTWTKLQLEEGSTATDYENAATSLPISWQTEAGTVYGGTIDVATGLLTVTHQIFLVPGSGITWTINNNAGYKSLSALGFTPSNMKNPPEGTANRTIVRTSWCKTNALKVSAGGWSTTTSSSEPQFVVSYDDYLMLNIGVANPTSAQINQFITDVGLQLYYPLATPQTYQLTPQQLMTLLGTNNVWADTGNVSVTYPADTKMFIEKLTMPTEDDLVANQAITSGKYFMVGNSLYLALANIASGAQITIGTNAQRVSLADALNSINS